MVNEAEIRRAENRLFFRRWLKNPRQLGTLAPISIKLAKLAAQAALGFYKPGQSMVEIGAGTGRLTRALLAAGVQAEDLTVVELDGEMCSFLRKTVPDICVIEGDALDLPRFLPLNDRGEICTVVSAIPLMYLAENSRKSLINSAFAVLAPSAGIIHVTYNPRSPLRFWNEITAERVASAWLNIPPGFVWLFKQP
jgi:phosphatidylethanolamine/phosphatidyl-N-methylethanolamine N-methyltransferase